MPDVWREAGYFGTRYITGPQLLTLLLAIADERITNPDVTALEMCPIYGPTSPGIVRAAVLSGTDRANADFGTSYHPLDIRYSYSGWDTEGCKLADWAAYNIVRAIAEETVIGSEQRNNE